MIPRAVLFSNPDKASVQISPNGKYLSYLAPVNGVLNVHIADPDTINAGRAITDDKSRGIRSYFWLYDNEHIIYLQDDKGDENWHAHLVNITTKEDRDITPYNNVRAQIEGVSHKFPKEIIIGLNKRDPSYFDLYKFNLDSGILELIYENTENFNSIVIDDFYHLRFASKPTIEGGSDIYKFTEGLKTQLFFSISAEDFNSTYIVGFTKEGNGIYLSDSRGRNTSALISLDLESSAQEILFHNIKSDLRGVLIHPTENTVQAVSWAYEKTEWTTLDESINKDFSYLRSVSEGEINITSRTLDDGTWIVAFLRDDAPLQYYWYDRENKYAKFLCTNRPNLESYKLEKMSPVIIKSRDGLDLVCYLTLPENKHQPLPFILNVHGGPTLRDYWGLDIVHQWLASRGYAVLSINYRGSSGFGKSFINAGYGEWGAKMHDDLIDAVDWAIKEGIAEKNKVAIFGGSYGGYAVLAGLTFTPEVFACGVNIVGVSNLITLLQSIPPYWKPFYKDLVRKLGADPDTEEGREFLKSRSPLTFADRIQKPLLIGHGAHDPRVKQAESDQIVASMQAKNIPVTYVLYKDEGHGFVRPENKMSFFAITEQFLAQNLGGQAEPIKNDFEGSSMEIRAGTIPK